MKAFRLPSQVTFRPSAATAPKKDRDYLEWIHELPCLVTLRSPVVAAHLSKANRAYGHMGRGKGRKASDRWILPLTNEQHEAQHAVGEMRFWKGFGINPYVACLTLYTMRMELGDEATPIAAYIINNREIGKVK